MRQNETAYNYHTPRPPQQSVNQMDIMTILVAVKRMFVQHWFRWILLFLLSTGLTIGYQYYGFHPRYESYVTYAVSSGMSDNYDIIMADRISNSFQYLLRANGVYQKFYAELGLTMPEGEILPVSISSSHVGETNFVTIRVVCENAVQANQALEFVIREFDSLVNLVIGRIQYTIVEQTGYTDTMMDEFSWVETILKSIAVGLLLVCGILFLQGYLSNSVRNYEDIKNHLSIPFLGGIPRIRMKRRRKTNTSLISIYNDRISGEFSEAFYQIRSRVEKEMNDHGMQVLLVSSSVPGEGKTTISTNLAQSLAERGEQVLLIDCDLRNPSVAETAGCSGVAYGVLNVIKGEVSLMEAIIKGEEQHSDVLAGTDSVSDPTNYLASHEMKKLIERAATIYDYVILDTPPSAMLTDASILAEYADGVIYVVRQDYTRIRSIEEGVNHLGNSTVTMLGCIFNCVENNAGRYGYGRYGYGKYGYGKYGYGKSGYRKYGSSGKREKKDERRDQD